MPRATAVVLIVLLVALVGCEKKRAGGPSPVEPVAERRDARAGAGGATYSIRALRKPLYFEENRGQSDRRVRYLLRSPTYALFLTPAELVTVAGLPVPPTGDLAATRPLRGGPAAWLHAQRTGESATGPPAPPAVLRMAFVGARRNVAMRGDQKLSGTLDHILGKDPSQWIRNVPLYREVIYDDLYPGIDLKLTLRDERPEYAFHVDPGADIGAIRLRFTGAKKLSVDEEGNLRIALSGGEVIHTAPRFIEVDGERKRTRPGNFQILGRKDVGFEVAARTPGSTLIIDPLMDFVFADYMGISDYSRTDGLSPVVSAVGHNDLWFGGTTLPPTLFVTPTTPWTVGNVACAARLDLSLPAPQIFERCFGGTGVYLPSTFFSDIVALPGGEAYVLGYTFDHTFPQMSGPFNTPPAFPSTFDQRWFLLKLDSAGQVVASTYVTNNWLMGPGGYGAVGLAVEHSGSRPGVYVVGSVDNGYLDPSLITFGQLDVTNQRDVLVAKFDLDLSNLEYLTVLSGSREDRGFGITARDGHAYVVGHTNSPDLQTTPGAPDRTLGPGLSGPSSCSPPYARSCDDGFLAKLDPDGKISYTGQSPDSFLTYIEDAGGGFATDVALDSAGRIYVSAIDGAPAMFYGKRALLLLLPTSASSISTRLDLGAGFAFLLFQSVAVNSSNQVHLSGTSCGGIVQASPPLPAGGLALNLPVPIQCGSNALDAYVAIHDPPASFDYFTFIGGSDLDVATSMTIDEIDCVYLAGVTWSSDFQPALGSAPPPVQNLSTPSHTYANWLVQLCPATRTLTLEKARMTPEEGAQLGLNCGDQAYPGAGICWKVTLTHEAGEPLTDAVLLDTLPPGFTLDDVITRIDPVTSSHPAPSCDTSTSPIRCAVSQLEAGETATVWLRTLVGPGATVGETACNTVKAEIGDSAFRTGETQEDCLEIVAPPRLEVTKGRTDETAAALFGWDCAPDPVEPGDSVCFTVLVAHDPATAASEGVVLTDTLPPGLTLAEIRTTPGLACPCAAYPTGAADPSCVPNPPSTPNPLACTADALAGGQFVALHLRATVDEDAERGETYCNRVEVEGAGAEVSPEDPVESCVAVRAREPATLRFQKYRMNEQTAAALGWRCHGGEVEPGDIACFVIALTHGGGDPFPASTIEDRLPAGLAIPQGQPGAAVETTDGVACNTSNNPVICDTPPLAAGDNPVIIGLRTVVGPEAAPGETLCNEAELQVTDETVLPENPTSTCVTVKAPPAPVPVLHLSKRSLSAAEGAALGWNCEEGSVDPGDPVCFEVTLAHEPGTPASGPGTLRDLLPPAGLALLNSEASGALTCPRPGQTDPLDCRLDPLAGIDRATLQVQVQLDPSAAAGARICNVAEAEVPGAEVRIAEPAIGVPGAEACVGVGVPPSPCLTVRQRLLTSAEGDWLGIGSCDTPSFTGGTHLCFLTTVTLGAGCPAVDAPFQVINTHAGVLENAWNWGMACDVAYGTTDPIRCTVDALGAGEGVVLATRSLILDRPQTGEAPPPVPVPRVLCNRVAVEDLPDPVTYVPAPSLCVPARLSQ